MNDEECVAVVGPAIGAALTQCLQNGFEVPLYVSIMSRNGAGMSARYDWAADSEGLQATMLAEPFGGDLRAPINIMVSDSNGEAARIMLSQEGSLTFLH